VNVGYGREGVCRSPWAHTAENELLGIETGQVEAQWKGPRWWYALTLGSEDIERIGGIEGRSSLIAMAVLLSRRNLRH
jgi:hypothetical protein